jgi:hypothetical protein
MLLIVSTEINMSYNILELIQKKRKEEEEDQICHIFEVRASLYNGGLIQRLRVCPLYIGWSPPSEALSL